MSTYATLVTFFTGSGWLFTSIIADIMNDLCVFQPEHTSNTNTMKLKKSFSKIVKCYADVKELSELDINDITKTPFYDECFFKV